ncbi:MAG: flagellar basal body-associated FliL family protein [Gammaproteobacteria bacterium]
MAENGAELDLDDEAGAAVPKAARPWLKYLIIGLSLSLVLSGTVLATLYFAGALSGGGADRPATESAKANAKKQPEAHASKKPAGSVKYIALDPPFLVNFNGSGDIRYLQVGIELSAYRQEVLDAVKAQMPAIRNGLVLLLSSEKPSDLSSRAGKDKLRGEVLDTVRKVLKQQAGITGVQGAYFTSFVMQ